ncbi:hypothetical protein HDU93_007318 [Gonapodya sp. JEL0774]|nr:hypothetical protein HDU93_007318 [Gonapodya sp. JEL0774]
MPDGSALSEVSFDEPWSLEFEILRFLHFALSCLGLLALAVLLPNFIRVKDFGRAINVIYVSLFAGNTLALVGIVGGFTARRITGSSQLPWIGCLLEGSIVYLGNTVTLAAVAQIAWERYYIVAHHVSHSLTTHKVILAIAWMYSTILLALSALLGGNLADHDPGNVLEGSVIYIGNTVTVAAFAHIAISWWYTTALTTVFAVMGGQIQHPGTLNCTGNWISRSPGLLTLTVLNGGLYGVACTLSVAFAYTAISRQALVVEVGLNSSINTCGSANLSRRRSSTASFKLKRGDAKLAITCFAVAAVYLVLYGPYAVGLIPFEVTSGKHPALPFLEVGLQLLVLAHVSVNIITITWLDPALNAGFRALVNGKLVHPEELQTSGGELGTLRVSEHGAGKMTLAKRMSLQIHSAQSDIHDDASEMY